MSGLCLTSSGWMPPGGATVDLFMGFWSPVTGLTDGGVTLADGDTMTDGMYWICNDEGDYDLGSGSVYWSRDDQIYRGEVATNVYTKRELGPGVENTVVTASGGIVQTAQGHPVWTY